MARKNTTGWLAVATAVLCAFAAIAGAPGWTRPREQPRGESVDEVRSLLTATLPAGAMEVGEALAKARAGETVTVRGYIPAARGAFAEQVGEFWLAERPDAPDDAPRVTVRVVSGAGEVVKGSLRDRHGLRAGAEVFATGPVVGGEGALVLRASSLHIPRDPMPPGMFLAGAPAGARDVSEARRAGDLKKGDVVVLRGRVGGSREPFVPGRAVLTIVGRGLGACSDTPGDSCATPWDYCCETREDILANSVTVQVVEEKGRVLRTDLKGRRGLKELADVVVVGKVATSDARAVVVNATGLWVAP
jgi:hypothetical protein